MRIAPAFLPIALLYRGFVRKPLLWILLASLLIFLPLIVFFSVVRWLSGDDFHAILEEKSSEALHAKASLGPLRWGWFDLFTPHLHAEGLDSTSLRQLEASGLRSHFNPYGLLLGQWHVDEISLDNAELHIDTSRPKNNLEKTPLQAPSTLPSWIPSKLLIDVVRVAKADIFLALPEEKSLEILDTRLEAYPDGNEIRIEGSGGVMQSPYLPDLNIETVRCRIEPSLVDLSGADLSFPSGGTVHFEGSFPDVDVSTLKGRWEMVPIATLLPLLNQKITGTLEGSATIQWNQEGTRSIDGTVKAHDVTLAGIPMMDEVSRLTEMDAFHHLFLQQAQASFSLNGESTTWKGVVLESQGLIKLVGAATTQQGGALSGDFQLGLSSPIVKVIPGAAEVFSKDQHDGYFWTPLHVGGTLTHPTEDLTPRVTAAVLSNAGLLIQQGMKQGLQILGLDRKSPVPSGEMNNPAATPTPNPVEDIKQGAGTVIDTLGGFLK